MTNDDPRRGEETVPEAAGHPLRDLPFTLPSLRVALAGGIRPADVIAEVFRRIDAAADPGIFLHLADPDAAIAEAEAAEGPLAGIPFAVKDNIDVAGMPTTAACPAFAYAAERDAFVVARLRAAGAVPIGKTNLDQFATGLVGTRTPHCVPANALDPALVPGGSSSGSAVAVARGIVPFALGTDTAGSGRVPAALNNIVGVKPTLGALSMTGVVPACRTLDTVSTFALTVAEASEVFRLSAGYDPADPWSRRVPVPPLPAAPPHPTVGVPATIDAEPEPAAAFAAAVDALAAGGARIVPFDFAPFAEVAALLYDGAWVAERHAATEAVLAREPDVVHPVTRRVIERALRFSATDAFRDGYRLAALRRAVEPTLAAADVLLVPTVPLFPTLAAVAADPIGVNTRLGTYTNFVNLLDLCGIAVPVAARPCGLPGSVTVLATRGRDGLAAALASMVETAGSRSLGATGWPVPQAGAPSTGAAADEIEIAVCGAHMSGMALNAELTGRGARFLHRAETTAEYRLYALPGGPPARPGLVRTGDGAPVAVEVWAMPLGKVGGFLAGIPAPLGLGTLRLADGTAPKGFLCEAAAVADAEDVTRLRSWRAVVARSRIR